MLAAAERDVDPAVGVSLRARDERDGHRGDRHQRFQVVQPVNEDELGVVRSGQSSDVGGRVRRRERCCSRALDSARGERLCGVCNVALELHEPYDDELDVRDRGRERDQPIHGRVGCRSDDHG